MGLISLIHTMHQKLKPIIVFGAMVRENAQNAMVQAKSIAQYATEKVPLQIPTIANGIPMLENMFVKHILAQVVGAKAEQDVAVVMVPENVVGVMVPESLQIKIHFF